VRAYFRREEAARNLHCSFSDGAIETYVQDRVSKKVMRILPEAWRGHALWRETIIGGEIRASACDGMEGLGGQPVFLKQSAVKKFLADAARRKPMSAKADCQAWLEGLLRAAPRFRPKAKHQLREEAKAIFCVTWREFGECWKLANQAVPESTWRRPGRPKKT
jgi:hypothetical protein